MDISSYKYHIGVAFLAVIAGAVISFSFMTPQGSSVLDCQNRKQPCQSKTLTKRVSSCNEWYPHEPLDNLECDYTQQGVGNVTLVTDPANHITSMMSDQEVSAEIQSVNLFATYDLEFLPDGSMLVTEKHKGNLIKFQNGDRETIATFDVYGKETTGLMGLAVHPDFSENRYIYLYYTTESVGTSAYDSINKSGITEFVKSRIVRYRLENGGLTDETVLMKDITGSIFHAGGRLDFGPDGNLYATTGDGGAPRYGQDPGRLTGKILRITPDGSIPTDNPFNNSVWARGFKNPQSVDWHPDSGTLYATDHGNWRNDEINRIVKGGNYGWGAMICGEPTGFKIAKEGNPIDPLKCFKDWTLAPSSAVFVDDPEHPWYGDLFVTGLRSKHLHHFDFEGRNIVKHSIFWINLDVPGDVGMSRRLRDIEFRDGSLWVLGDWGGIAKLSSGNLTSS